MKASSFLKNLKRLTKEDLIGIKGLGEVLTENITKFTESDRYEELLGEFEKLEMSNKGLEIKAEARQKSGKLLNKTICITGKFSQSRDQIKTLLENQGGKVVSAVSSNTDYLLAGEDAGSKLEKAKELKVKIVNNLNDLIQN